MQYVVSHLEWPKKILSENLAGSMTGLHWRNNILPSFFSQSLGLPIYNNRRIGLWKEQYGSRDGNALNTSQTPEYSPPSVVSP